MGFHNVLDPGDSQALTNFYRWGTEESSVQDAFTQRFNTILTLMRDSVDHDEISLLIQEAEQIVANQALFLPLYADPASAVYWPNAIEGFVMNVDTSFTWNIETWEMTESA